MSCGQRPIAWRTLVPFIASVALTGIATAQSAALPAVLLRHGVRPDSADLAVLETGEAIARVIPTQDSRDVAVIGAVRLAATRDLYIRRVQDVRTWLRTPTRTRLGLFADPATLADVDGVSVARQDLEDLRKCRPGDCKAKLPASTMQLLQDEVNWSAPDVQAQVTALARRRMVAVVEEYREQGNAALPTYDDHPPVRASEAFLALLAQSTYLAQAAPALATYFRVFPRNRPAGVSDVMFWSEDVVPRLRPILSITHMMVHTPPALGGTTVIASRQLYANHFFEAALEVVSVNDRDAGGTWLVIERRFRFDNLPKGGLLNIRGRAIAAIRDQLQADLRRERDATARPLTGLR